MTSKRLFQGLATGLASVALSLPVVAAEDSGGLPQLDFSTWPTQVFWLFVSFGLAYVLMNWVVAPRIGSVLEDRHNRIEDDMRVARQVSDEAESLRLSFEKTLSDARSDASEKVRASLAVAAAESEKKSAAAAKRLSARIEKAESRISQARVDALKELDAVAIEGAIEASVVLAGVRVSKSEAKAAVLVAKSVSGGVG